MKLRPSYRKGNASPSFLTSLEGRNLRLSVVPGPARYKKKHSAGTVLKQYRVVSVAGKCLHGHWRPQSQSRKWERREPTPVPTHSGANPLCLVLQGGCADEATGTMAQPFKASGHLLCWGNMTTELTIYRYTWRLWAGMWKWPKAEVLVWKELIKEQKG
jgi:hypothetical protein